MSRTNKDRPYWVKLNDGANSTDHDHLSLGKKVYRRRYVQDEGGRLLYEEIPEYMTASAIMHKEVNDGWIDRAMVPGKAYREARNLASAGRGNEEVLVRVTEQPVREDVLVWTVEDRCTEGEKYLNRQDYWSGRLPCTPNIIGVSWRSLQMSGKAGLKKSYSRLRYSSERVTVRDSLGELAKRFNSGEEIDDFNDLPVTNQHHHSMAWDLY